MAIECAVCAHAEVKTLDQQLASGAAVTLLAEKYQLAERTITEHRNKHLGIQRRPRFDRYGDTPDSLIDELTTLKATAEARLSVCGDDHKSAAALIRESRCIDEAVAKIRGFLDKGSHQGCIPLAKHQFAIQLVTEALREFPEARAAVIAAVERAEEERNRHSIK
jgi:hypothetical protein